MRRSLATTGAWAAGALLCFSAAVFIAIHHPLSGLAALGGLVAWTLACWRWRSLWLFAVPALLPAANLAPWTGWLIFDEFDLLVLGALAAGWVGLARRDPASADAVAGVSALTRRPPRRWVALAVTLAALSSFQLFRGLGDAGAWSFGWFQGYADPLNAWRQYKGVLYALLTLPMLHGEIERSRDETIRRLSAGMLVGITLVALTALYERAAYTGLWNFSRPYRTTALFWEMHVGGGAIDVYLAMAAPFVAWALWSARSWAQWTFAASVALLCGYAVLTTFSRGVYLGVAGSLLLLGIWLWSARWRSALHAARLRRFAATMLTLGLLAEAVAVLTGGSFMLTRLAAAERDFGNRMTHWRRGLALLDGPADWLWGIGLGRLPSHYAHSAPGGEFSGTLAWSRDAASNPTLTLRGPLSKRRLGGLYGLTQRIDLHPSGPYGVRLRVRTATTLDLVLAVCEMHLLYPRQCDVSRVRLPPASGSWRDVDVKVGGPVLSRGDWYAPRQGVFEVSVLSLGGAADFSRIALRAADGMALLRNEDFAAGSAHWFPTAHIYFLPWHIDSLWLELVIERGLSGVLVIATLVGWALWRLSVSRRAELPFASFLAASLCGALLVGLVSSVMDTPRIAFTMLLLSFLAIQLTEPAAAIRADPDL